MNLKKLFAPFNKRFKSVNSFRFLSKSLPQGFYQTLFFNLIIALGVLGYLTLRYEYVNSTIPFWYTKPWGDPQLANKSLLFLLPLLSIIFTILGLLISVKAKKLHMRYSAELINFAITLWNILMGISVIRIIFEASSPFDPLVSPIFISLAIPFMVSMLLAYFLTPGFIKFAKEKNLYTDPSLHNHPGMILVRPSARGGGVVFAMAFVLTLMLFVPISKVTLGITAAVVISAFIGLMDDYSNTNPGFKFKAVGNPLVRLLVLSPIAVLFVLAAGIRTDFIGNPLGDGLIFFDTTKFTLLGTEFAPIAIIFTFLWILWIINMLSWSNGVDGQYSGIIGITGIVVAILSLRLLPTEPSQQEVAKIAVILAGASIGLIPFTWHPSKIMWGYSATAAGIVIATLSIITRAKIATSIIILLIPFLDGLITVLRRLLQKRSPLKGDRGHLHHLLLNRGWSVKKISLFYWFSTAILGVIALVSSDRGLALSFLTIGGVIAFFIILLNLKSGKDTQELQEPA